LGNYVATLTVTDHVSASASASISINVTTTTSANLEMAAQTGSPAPGQGGTTDPSPGTYSYSIGSSVAVTSLPNTDYRFSRWEGDIAEAKAFDSETTIMMDSNKSVSSTFCTKCADVNGDLNITPSDAQLAFDIYLKKVSSPTWCESENADVNASGTKLVPKVTPADAQMIFNKYLRKGNINPTCLGTYRASVTALQNPIPSPSNLAISGTIFNQGEDIAISIIVDSLSAIGAFGFDLVFPSDRFAFVGLERTDLTEGFEQVDANVIPSSMSAEEDAGSPDNSSILRVGGYKTVSDQSASSGVLVTLVFRRKGEVAEPGAMSIVATYDDLQTVSWIDRMINPQDDSLFREDPMGRREIRPSGKRYDC
jgi:hypothetical protein